MELIDRYLQAVRFWLPKSQADDILAELSEDIRSQISDEEEVLGHALGESEVEAILRKRGRPMVVASRYLPQRWLIGPVFFPIYWMILKISVASYLVSWFLVWLGILIFDRTYGAHHGALAIIGQAWGSVWGGLFVAAGTITLVFALLEHGQNFGGFLKYWNPRDLPPIRDPNRGLRLNSACELAGYVVVFIWWATMMRSETIFDRAGLRVVLTGEWRAFFFALLVLVTAGAMLSLVNLVRPYWTRGRAWAKLGMDCAGAALWCWLFKAHMLAEIMAPNLSQARSTEIVNAINTNMAKSFPFAVLACALAIGLADGGRLIRMKPSAAQLAPKLAIALVIAFLAWGLN
jgi:hypothetical protein